MVTVPLHQMQGAQILRSDVYLQVRRNDEGSSAIRHRRTDGLFTKPSKLKNF